MFRRNIKIMMMTSRSNEPDHFEIAYGSIGEEKINK